MTPDTITVEGVTYVRAYPVAPGRCACCGAGPRAWTPAQVLAALQADPAPKADRWLEPVAGRPTFSTVRRMFGTWNRAIEAAGLGRRGHGMQTYWTRERIIDAILAWARAHDGVQPRYSDWQKGVAEHPSATTVRKMFGSWNAAIDAAGFVPLASYGNPAQGFRGPKGKRELVHAAPVAAAVRDYLGADGDALRLAELMGVDPTPIHKLLSGRRDRMTHDAADEILTAISRPDVLASLDVAA